MKIYAEIYREVEPKRCEKKNDKKINVSSQQVESTRVSWYWWLTIIHRHAGLSAFENLFLPQEQAPASPRETGVQAKATARSECGALPGSVVKLCKTVCYLCVCDNFPLKLKQRLSKGAETQRPGYDALWNRHFRCGHRKCWTTNFQRMTVGNGSSKTSHAETEGKFWMVFE